MSENAVIRRIGELGRIVLPIDLRRSLDWQEGDRIEIAREGDSLILKRHEERCCFCGGETRLKEYRGKLICGRCIGKLSEL